MSIISIAMDVEKNDELVEARLCNDKDDVMIVTRKGQSIRFSVAELRSAFDLEEQPTEGSGCFGGVGRLGGRLDVESAVSGHHITPARE